MVRDPTRTTARNEEPELPPNIFVIGLLHDLKAGNYSRQAWGAFIRASWVRSLQIIQENGELRSSWLRFAVAGITGIVIATVAVLRFAPQDALLFLVTSLLWWGVLMSDVGLHLGLMVNLESGELQRTLGWPNRLTELRGFSSIWVAWGAHWASGGVYVPLVAVFGVAAATDLVDGWLARRRHAATRWGRLYDPFIDGIFFSVSAISLAAIGVVPQWLAALITFRYAFPIVGGMAFLFVRRRTLRVRHTMWGRLSSGGIAVTVFAAAGMTWLGLPFSTVAPGLYVAVCIAMLGAFITILLKGIEQA
ncbi:MAG: CDP-alcohol phosphatidyltransferase family protein [Chloroflexi bacterium]|nr:MAG: CDP-alcohol phosphatidyltransferase family protein [Chloroflexota bacterium]